MIGAPQVANGTDELCINKAFQHGMMMGQVECNVHCQCGEHCGAVLLHTHSYKSGTVRLLHLPYFDTTCVLRQIQKFYRKRLKIGRQLDNLQQLMHLSYMSLCP